MDKIFTIDELLFKGIILLRLIIAVVCGLSIGIERENRGKGAGLRTHAIVAIASCLMMIISQYGFNNFFERMDLSLSDVKIDPSRVAAQIVTGVGFLGAGMIFIQKNAIIGLTTAAGVWATAGIGMAIGCGMYFLGIVSTVIIILVQLFIHKSTHFTYSQTEESMSFCIDDSTEALSQLTSIITDYNISIAEMSYTKTNDNKLDVEMLVWLNKRIDKEKMIEKLRNCDFIQSVKI